MGNPGEQTLQKVAEFVGRELGWGEKKIETELLHTTRDFDKYSIRNTS